MEGIESEDNYNEGEQLDTQEIKEDTIEDSEEGIEDIHKDQSKIIIRNSAFPIVLIFIVVIIGPFTYLYISGIMEEKPIYQQYKKQEVGDTIVYSNFELDVHITIFKHNDSANYYVADWKTKDDEYRSANNLKPLGLLDEIVEHTEYLTTNQLRWFEYILTNVVK